MDLIQLLTQWGVALVFLAVSFTFPQRLATWAEEPLAIGNDVEQLLAKVEVLRDEKLIDKQRSDILAEQIRQVQEKAEGRNPAKTLEALDHLREQIQQAAQKAAEAAVEKSEKLGAAEGLADAIRKNDGVLDDKVMAEALAELNDLVKKADLEGALLDLAIDPELLKKLAESNLSSEDLKKLADALKGAKLDLEKVLGRLEKMKLIDADALKRLLAAGKCDCAGMLKECGGKLAVRDIVGRCRGNGGPGGGGPPAPITWTDGTSEEGVAYKEEILPPSDLAQLKNSQVIGVHRADPKKAAQSSHSGALQGATAGGGAANAGTLLPQHRTTVERFFDRTPKKE